MTKTIIGSLAQVLESLSLKFSKRLYLGQVFKFADTKYYIRELRETDDKTLIVVLKKGV